jgi:hypothetical protein
MQLKERGVNLKKIHQSLSKRVKVGFLDGYPVVLLAQIAAPTKMNPVFCCPKYYPLSGRSLRC